MIAILGGDLVSWGPVIVGIFAIIVALVSNIIITLVNLWNYSRTHRHNQKVLNEHLNSSERQSISQKISDFYAPLKQLRKESIELYNIFAIEEKKAKKNEGSYFRTVTHLAKNRDLSDLDKHILGEIISVSTAELELIEGKSNVVDNPSLSELLGRFACHIRVLKLLYDKRGIENSEVFDQIVYPLEIDGAIESEILRLQERYDKLLGNDLRGRLTKSPMSDKKTISFYNENSGDYYNRTAYLDLSDIYSRFKKHMVGMRGGRILDAGCGVGRDTQYFVKCGYTVEAFDASIEMVKNCQQYPFAYCFHASFGEITYSEVFDGVWACASLLHLKRENVKQAFEQLVKSCRPNGVIFVSLKDGIGEQRSNRRLFTFYKQEEFERLAMSVGLVDVADYWCSKSLMEGDEGSWHNWVFRRKPIVSSVKASAEMKEKAGIT